jgi:V8-like Glu-specific endopeptidase
MRWLFSFFFVLGISAQALAFPLPQFPRSHYSQSQKEMQTLALPKSFSQNYDFEGIVSLSNCSGSLIRFESSQDSDLGLVLTNGHCLETGFSEPGQVVLNQPSARRFKVMNSQGQSLGNLNAAKVLYSTMTKTDITIYQLHETYADILSTFQVHPLTLASTHPQAQQRVDIVSGYWEKGYSCDIETFVNELRESRWVFSDSIRFTRPGCETIGGTSGSPILLSGTRTVIGINNTGNESGEQCTMNNPCEVAPDGTITSQQGYSYGQQTYWIYSCLNEKNEIDVNRSGCLLPHPAPVH